MNRTLLAILGVSWLLLGSTGGCGWTWSSDPLIFIPEEAPCDAGLELWLWHAPTETSELLAEGLMDGDCVRGFDLARWGDHFLFCRATESSSTLTRTVELGAKNAARRAQCLRFINLGES